MAIFRKRNEDLTEQALLAIQEALNTRDRTKTGATTADPAALEKNGGKDAGQRGLHRGPRAGDVQSDVPPRRDIGGGPRGVRGGPRSGDVLSDAQPRRDIETGRYGLHGGSRAADASFVAPPRQEEANVVRAANDDWQTAGHMLEWLHRPPANTPFIVATMLATIWLIGTLGLVYGFGGALRNAVAAAGLLPLAICVAGAVGAPIAFFYAVANMTARTQELRNVANAMAEAALRFAQPETTAGDAIISVGQAICSEVAAMADGIERAVARGAELETLVAHEVSAIERAYDENEVRFHRLLDGLARQRETLVDQAERTCNAISSVHLDLSHDIAATSELIAFEVTQNITRSLNEKSEQMTIALAAAVDRVIEQLAKCGTELLNWLGRTGTGTIRAMEGAGNRLTATLKSKSDHLSEQVNLAAASLEQSITRRFDKAMGVFSEQSATLLEKVDERVRDMTKTMSGQFEAVSQDFIGNAGRLAETVGLRGEEVNSVLKSVGELIVVDLGMRGNALVSKIEDIGTKITEEIIAHSDCVAQQFGNNAGTLAESMFTRIGRELVDRIGRDASTLCDVFTRHLGEFDLTLKTQGSDVIDNLRQQTSDLQSLMNDLNGFDFAGGESSCGYYDVARTAIHALPRRDEQSVLEPQREFPAKYPRCRARDDGQRKRRHQGIRREHFVDGDNARQRAREHVGRHDRRDQRDPRLAG